MTAGQQRPGRSCPASYRYGAAALRTAARVAVDTLYVAGGLYGNPFALEALLALYQAEPGSKALVFNGDFHWFDADAASFARIDDAVLRHIALRGNVETEIGAPEQGAGCGCGYPEFVDDGTVERSNRILERLRAAASSPARRVLAALPMHCVAEIGGERVAIVHGDAESLAGWGFSQELLATPVGAAAAEAAFGAAGASVFASSHSCLPVLQSFGAGRALINNGAAGMPNFRGTHYGLATRISLRPAGAALYGTRVGRVHVEALAIDYDRAAWRRHFLALWPAGSDAHGSYFERIEHGPRYELPQARRAA